MIQLLNASFGAFFKKMGYSKTVVLFIFWADSKEVHLCVVFEYNSLHFKRTIPLEKTKLSTNQN